MHLKYLTYRTNACGYPTNHPPDKCFELSVSRNQLSRMAPSSFPKHISHIKLGRQLCNTGQSLPSCPDPVACVPRDAGRSRQGQSAGGCTGRNWLCPRCWAPRRGRILRAAVPGAVLGTETDSAAVPDVSPRDRHLTGPDSLLGLFLCSLWDMAASRYQSSPYGKLPTQQSLIRLHT